MPKRRRLDYTSIKPQLSSDEYHDIIELAMSTLEPSEHPAIYKMYRALDAYPKIGPAVAAEVVCEVAAYFHYHCRRLGIDPATLSTRQAV